MAVAILSECDIGDSGSSDDFYYTECFQTKYYQNREISPTYAQIIQVLPNKNQCIVQLCFTAAKKSIF